jgi:hypothetical protein
MAKGQVTEEELSSGLKGIGDFSVLGGAPRVRRDNPFRDSRSENPAPAFEKTIEVQPFEDVPPPAPIKTPQTVERKRSTPAPRKVETIRKADRPTKIEERQSGGESPEKTKPSSRKADVLTERVTLQMSPEMRDEVDSLARDLQRARTEKGERITANTVMRVAVQLLIDHFHQQRGEAVNSEEQLYNLATEKLKLR